MKKFTAICMLIGCAVFATGQCGATTYYYGGTYAGTTSTTMMRINEILGVVETVVRIVDPAPVVVVQQPAYYPQVVYYPQPVYYPPAPPVIRPVMPRPAPPPMVRPPAFKTPPPHNNRPAPPRMPQRPAPNPGPHGR